MIGTDSFNQNKYRCKTCGKYSEDKQYLYSGDKLTSKLKAMSLIVISNNEVMEGLCRNCFDNFLANSER